MGGETGRKGYHYLAPLLVPYTISYTHPQAAGLSVFTTDPLALERARDLLCTVGLIRRSPSPGHVGVVHKLAQKCAREAMVAMPETSTTLKAVCYILTDRFQFDQHGSLGAWPGLQNLLPSTS